MRNSKEPRMRNSLPLCADSPIELPTARTHLFDPAPELAVLREERPLCRLRYPGDHVGWLGTSFELAKALFADPRFSRRPPQGLSTGRFPVGDPVKIEEFFRVLEREGAMAANFLEL